MLRKRIGRVVAAMVASVVVAAAAGVPAGATHPGADGDLWVTYYGFLDAEGSSQPAVPGAPGRVLRGNNAAWSPDGARLAGMSWSRYLPDIFVHDPGTDDSEYVTRTDDFSEREPSWSPDGRHLVFAVHDGGADDRYWLDVMRDDGSGRRTLIPPQADEVDGPDWAPNGSRIAFRMLDAEKVTRLVSVRPDGSDLRVHHVGVSYGISWSPDSRSIAIFSFEHGTAILDVATDAVRTVLPASCQGIEPAWSPSGTRLAVTPTSVSPGCPLPSPGVWTVGLDGTGASLVRAQPGQGASYRNPSWRPQPTLPAPLDTGACPAGRVPDDAQADVAVTSVHEASVDCAVWWGVATGTGPDLYDPNGRVTRAQMATFLDRALRVTGHPLPPTTVDHFPDDEGNTHEAAIDRLAAAGIVQGRADGGYGPSLPVSRDQMATFLVRTLEHVHGPLAPGADAFDDDDGNVHEPAIDRAAAAGLVSGTGERRYGPSGAVRRDQMATFVTRLLTAFVELGAPLPG